MTSLFVVRIAGVFALLAVVSQFAAVGIALASGIQPGAPLNFSDGAQLLAAADANPGVLGLVFATISPSLGLPLGIALYVVLKDAKGYAMFGAMMFYVGQTIALVHEVLRIALFWRMPGLYQRATMVRGGEIIDGAHRIARAHIEGRETIAAAVLEEYPKPDGELAEGEVAPAADGSDQDA